MSILDIIGGRVIDATGAPPRENCTVRVENGRIAALWSGGGPPAPARRPADRTIDAAGCTVMPGLIDAHWHISYGEGRSAEEIDLYGGPEWSAVRAVWNCGKVLRAGVTSFCDPGSTWFVSSATRDAIANGMFPGPRIFAAGRHIAADGGFADYYPSWLDMPVSAQGVLCSSKAEMVREIRQQVKNRVDLVKLSGDSQAQEKIEEAGPCFSDEEMSAVVSTTYRLGRKSAIHARFAETVLAAVRAKVDWIVHAIYLRRQDLGYVRDSRIPICPTLTFTANIVDWGKDVGVDPKYVETKRRELDTMAEIHTRSREAGVTLLAGSESGFSITPYGQWHARELELMVDLLGLSPMEAIVAATRDNAATFGWKDVGTLEVGRSADILVVDGDPLADIRILGERDRFRWIIKEGREVERRDDSAERLRMGHERAMTISARLLNRAETRRTEG
jgi:imidazolonepropionase-like amidohydrolase